MILVLGVGRSGTSLVAGMLQRLGVHMGDDLLEAGEKVAGRGTADNPWGYYEDNEFRNLNIDFQTNKIPLKKFLEGIDDIVDKRKEPWGLKDPMVAQLLPYYLTYFRDAQIIWCQRNIKDIMESMDRNYFGQYDEIIKHVAQAEADIYRLTKGMNVLALRYEDRKDHLKKLCTFTGLDPTKEAKEFVKK